MCLCRLQVVFPLKGHRVQIMVISVKDCLDVMSMQPAQIGFHWTEAIFFTDIV